MKLLYWYSSQLWELFFDQKGAPKCPIFLQTLLPPPPTKTKPPLIFSLCLILLFSFTFFGCKDKDDDPPEPTRVFTDITFQGKPITLIDQTGNPKDLKERFLWHKVKNGFEAILDSQLSVIGAFNTAYEHGFAIIVTTGTTYSGGAGINGYKLLFNDGQLSGYSAIEVRDFIGAVELMPDQILTKAMPKEAIRMARVTMYGAFEINL